MLTNNQPNLSYQLSATPQTALIDEPITIRVSNLPPGQLVVLRTQTRDDNGITWGAHASFRADSQGNVQVSQQAPQSGSYSEVEPQGLLWSMKTSAGDGQHTIFAKPTASPLSITLSAEVEGQPAASVTLQRFFMAPSVTRTQVREQGLVGTLFMPAGAGPHPAVLVLAGSDGGIQEGAAALLASHGYASLALAYIQGLGIVDGLPRYLVELPLEYFETAINWFLGQQNIDRNRLSVLGHSRGGELALLLGTLFPQIRGVIAGSPSSIIQSAITTRTIDKPGWTFHNKPFPYLNITPTFNEILGLIWKQITHAPVSFQPLFTNSMQQHPAEVQEATIPVEKIHGPVLVISGQDDHTWPSHTFGEQIVSRLNAQRHPYRYEHITYEHSGHLLCAPYGLPSLPPMHCLPIGNLTLDCGGHTREQAWAASDSWRKILAFLRTIPQT